MRLSRSLSDLASLVMVDFNQMKAFVRDPLVLVEGEGIRVRDAEGKWYVDGLSGVFTVSLGYSNREVIESVKAQLDTLVFSSPIMSTNDRALELAETLVRLTGERMSVVKLLTGGSEATEAAIKIARQYHRQSGSPGRYKVVSLYESYHGATMGALSATGHHTLWGSYEPLAAGFVHVQPPHYEAARLPLDGTELGRACTERVRDVIAAEGVESVAAYIVEPVMTTAGIRVPPPGYLAAMREVCDETGVLFIADEIVTAFGRLGEMFGSDLFDFWPDLMCVGKGIAGGYAPLSAVMLSPRVAEAFWGEPGEQFKSGHTFAFNPVSAAGGLAVIGYLERNRVPEHVRGVGDRLRAGLDALAAASRLGCEVRGMGLLWAFDFISDPGTGRRFDRRTPIATAAQQAARRRGLLVRASPATITFAPPLVVSEGEVDDLLALFEESVREVEERYLREGEIDVEVAFAL